MLRWGAFASTVPPLHRRSGAETVAAPELDTSRITISCEGSNYDGFVVIDTVFHGTSSGGVRIFSDLTLREVQDLAREMSLKYALFGLPRGGAKAGIRLRTGLTEEARNAALLQFGHRIGPIIRAGIYNPGMDMNCGPAELRQIYAGAGILIGKPTDTSFYTAMSTKSALLGLASVLGDAGRLDLGIDGFGSVAAHLARMLPPGRFRIVAVSTVQGAVYRPSGFEASELLAAREQHGDRLVLHLAGERLPIHEIAACPMDLYVPAARTRGVTPAIARAIRVKAVVPVANAPYDGDAVNILHSAGTICLPGFLCNAGGVVGSSLADTRLPSAEVSLFFDGSYRNLVERIVTVCRRLDIPATSAVEEYAATRVLHRLTTNERMRRSIADRVVRRIAPRVPARALRKQIHCAMEAAMEHFGRLITP